MEITSNRSDCQSHYGLARELAAGAGCELRPPDVQLPDGGQPVDELTSVSNEDLECCPVYTARVIRGVKVGPSPQWLVQRLEAIGLRSINNVVDVTNFVLFETGQPLHAFDMSLLGEKRIVVRRAGEGEAFTAIDGTKHKLQSDMLIIADAARPVAIAGVMGGLESEVGQQTDDVLLESAVFDPLSVRRTSRRLKLFSDSSYRFERGVDPLGVDRASRRAGGLILELAGGQLAAGAIRRGAPEPRPHTVTMRTDRCRKLLGLDLPDDEMAGLLARLGLSPQHDAAAAAITCTIPTYRLYLHREVDLIEEIARLHGLDDLPVHERIEIVAQPLQAQIAARQRLGQVLTAHGYHETMTFSFVSLNAGRQFLPDGDDPAVLDDEQRKAEPMLRPSLLPSLLACRKSNQDVGNADVAMYETADVWSRRSGAIAEGRRLAMLHDAPDPPAELRAMRGALEELADELTAAKLTMTPGPGPWYTDGASILLDDKPIGAVGILSQPMQDRFSLQTPAVLAEIDLPALLASYPPARTVATLSRFPGIERDLSVIVNEAVTWQQVRQCVAAAEPALLETVTFIGAYRGKPIAKGRKSITFRMTYRDAQTTLRHEQVDPQIKAIVERLTAQVGAELRT